MIYYDVLLMRNESKIARETDECQRMNTLMMRESSGDGSMTVI